MIFSRRKESGESAGDDNIRTGNGPARLVVAEPGVAAHPEVLSAISAAAGGANTLSADAATAAAKIGPQTAAVISIDQTAATLDRLLEAVLQ